MEIIQIDNNTKFNIILNTNNPVMPIVYSFVAYTLRYFFIFYRGFPTKKSKASRTKRSALT